MIRRPPRSTQSRSSAASDVYKRQASRADLQPLLYDAQEGERDRAVDGLPDGAAARRRDRSAVDRGARNHVPDLPAAGAIARGAGHQTVPDPDDPAGSNLS